MIFLSQAKVTTDKKFLKAALEAHNDYRKKHGASSLKLDDDVSWKKGLCIRNYSKNGS